MIEILRATGASHITFDFLFNDPTESVHDSALMKTFGEAGLGIFPGPDVIADDISRNFHAGQIGVIDGVAETFIAISPQRRLRHPSVLRIAEHAKAVLSD